MDNVNPNNIEKVTVLKDASAAAIYGARAAFGVIQITTKSGKDGKPEITYSSNFSWKTFARNTDFITTGYDYLQIANEAYEKSLGRTLMGYSEDDMEELYQRRNDKIENPDRPWVVVKPADNGSGDVYKYYGNFDWFNYFNNTWRHKEKQNLTFSGGNEEITYYLSGSITHEKGIFNINPDYYGRQSVQSKINYNILPWLTIKNNTRFFASNYTYHGIDHGGFKGGIDTKNQFYFYYPNLVPKNPDRTNTYRTENGTYAIGGGTHAALASDNTGGNNSKKNLRSTFEAQIHVFKDLELTANYTYKYNNGERNIREVPLTYSLYPGKTETISDWKENRLDDSRDWTNYQAVNIYADYQKTFDLHNLKITGGFNQQINKYKRIYGTAYNLVTSSKNDFDLSTGRTRILGGQSTWALQSLFYRFNYDYNKKYYLETSGRYDGSSRFPKDDRFGYFPSISVGWAINKENFFKPLNNIFDLFKVRASYGSLGNQVVDPYISIPGMSVYQMSYLNSAHNKLDAVASPNPVSARLTWEKISTKNVGLDMEVFNNRLTIGIDGYIRDTKNMLTKGKTLPAVYGAPEPRENAADLRTKGYEISIEWGDAVNIGSSQLSYHIGAHLSDYVGHITRFDNPDKVLSDYYVGQKFGDIWGFVYDGMFKTNEEAQAYDVDMSRIARRRNAAPDPDDRKLQAGDIKILDLNGDGVIDYGSGTVDDPGDRKIIGNSQPRYKYGFQLGGSYRGISLNAQFQGLGHQNFYPWKENILFWGVYSRPYASYIPRNFKDKMWSPDNRDAYFPRVFGYMAQNSELSVPNDMYLQNLAYLKLRNLTIGYELPNNLISKVGLSHARIYVTGTNLFTWTAFDTDYLDPEEVTQTATGRTYPMGKSYSFGVSITF